MAACLARRAWAGKKPSERPKLSEIPRGGLQKGQQWDNQEPKSLAKKLNAAASQEREDAERGCWETGSVRQ